MVSSDFNAVSIGQAVTVSGGLLKKEEMVESRKTRCGRTFVKIDKSAVWLSKAITGSPPCGRPLMRTNIIETMKGKLHRMPSPESMLGAEVEDPMLDMVYDDMPPVLPCVETPQKPLKRKRRYKVQHSVEREEVIAMVMEDIYSSGDGVKETVTLLACAKNIWLEDKALPWFMKAMHYQYTTGSVPQVVKDHEMGGTAPQQNVWWNFRDDAWCCRAKHLGDGKYYSKTLGLAHRHKRSKEPDETYATIKDKAYNALCKWQASIMAGGDPTEAVPNWEHM
jgi:hypothetical protein